MMDQVLVDLGTENEDVWTVCADMSTYLGSFRKAFPDRYIDVGIAEQTSVGIAAGLALEGAIPFVAGMAPFISMRSLEQVRSDVCYQDLPVKFVAWYGGLTTGGGSTHNAMEDIALMKQLVNMDVVSVGDPNMVGALMRASMDHPHPLYIRFGVGKGDPCLYDPETISVEIGKGILAREGSDATILAHGDLVFEALRAAEALAETGVNARVVDMYSIKPLDKELLLRCVEETGHIVVVEDHLTFGGLASSIADALMDERVMPRSFRRLGVPQIYSGFGSPQVNWAQYGYDRGGIVAAVIEMLG
ncbi:hypothetical protein LK12_17180 [Novosphingobium malaysiense]|uniref:1-deoxy-D-xylulose-5-phosphate synthase n=1 Tax=Novosphingobium malaysiense TaxID=1348853 RepID=A0A0B1ZMQ5_9SPHN|nr:hypothetical protein LK12_17180 [Novosphingobium malaysiense]